MENHQEEPLTVLQGFLLGILQGIAEFLPISSSGHLKVAQHLLGLEDVPLFFDVLLHIATLGAVVIYFRKVIAKLFAILFRWIFRKSEKQAYNVCNVAPAKDTDARIAALAPTEEIGRNTIIMVIITTLVTGVLGIASKKLLPELPLKAVAAGFVVTALLLIASKLFSRKHVALFEPETEIKDDFYAVQDTAMTPIQAIIIGVAQGIGTLPGISRSGSTIAGALLCKVDRRTAGDYSFLVSIPAILGAFALTLKDVMSDAAAAGLSAMQYFSETVGIAPAAAGFVTALVFGYAALAILMKIIQKGKIEWFAAYLIPLGILGLIFF